MQSESDRLRREGKRIAVVPTMGALHRGHTSLIELARKHADVVVTTIFVNPTQFGPTEDLARYPRDLDRDTTLAQAAGTDILFTPSASGMYPEGFKTFVSVEEITSVFEGEIRPTHFRGVTTVVAKLFNIVKPHVGVFGQKDIQQVHVIRRMTRDLDFGVELVVGPTVREADGLALSSRNAYLTPEERSRATALYRSLRGVAELVQAGERSVGTLRDRAESILHASHPTRVDYVAFLDPETFRPVESIATPGILVALAVRYGTTRLIDNEFITI